MKTLTDAAGVSQTRTDVLLDNSQTGANTQTSIFNINNPTFGKLSETFQPRIVQSVG